MGKKLLRNPDDPYPRPPTSPSKVKCSAPGACKPEDGWYGQPKHCYEKVIHVVTISFAVVFGLLVSSAPKRMFNKT